MPHSNATWIVVDCINKTRLTVQCNSLVASQLQRQVLTSSIHVIPLERGRGAEICRRVGRKLFIK